MQVLRQPVLWLSVFIAALLVAITGQAAGWSEFYRELKAWQSALAILGALVTVYGMLRSQREQQEALRERDEKRDIRERLAVATAIRSEIVSFNNRLRMRVEFFDEILATTRQQNRKPVNQRAFESWEVELTDPVIYTASASNLGLLHPAVSQQTTHYYLGIQEWKQIAQSKQNMLSVAKTLRHMTPSIIKQGEIAITFIDNYSAVLRDDLDGIDEIMELSNDDIRCAILRVKYDTERLLHEEGLTAEDENKSWAG